jgi:hypothetical protein
MILILVVVLPVAACQVLLSPNVSGQSYWTVTLTTTTNSTTYRTTLTGNESDVPVQSALLGFLAQQAIAHGALIFATLTAAFAFAVGFRKLDGKLRRLAYWLATGALFTLSIYSLLRLFFYSQFSNFVLEYPPEYAASLCTTVSLDSHVHYGGFTWYFSCVQDIVIKRSYFSHQFLSVPAVYFLGGVTRFSLVPSIILGFVIATVFTKLFVQKDL